MSRFAFLETKEPELYALCLQVEKYQYEDTDLFVLKCRNAMEQLTLCLGCSGSLKENIGQLQQNKDVQPELVEKLLLLVDICDESSLFDDDVEVEDRNNTVGLLVEACRMYVEAKQAANTDYSQELAEFLDASPVNFYAIRNIISELELLGLERLDESKKWHLEPGKGYYVTRNDSAIMAFYVPKQDYAGYQIMASHCDSPSFRIKPNAEIVVEKKLLKLNVEKYGGMICSTWLDRPLSLAGRVIVRTAKGIATKLINIDKDLLIIPNLAIHMSRDINEGYKFNAQVDMLPLLGDGNNSGALLKLIAAEAGVAAEDVLDTDLFLYNRMKASFVGADQQFICSGRLDDLQCVFATVTGFTRAVKSGAVKASDSVPVLCVLDNEEVGSGTKQGAASTFLKDVLQRINSALGRDQEDYVASLANSFMVSADNAHAVHPNHTDKADPTNRPYLNEGIVIKYSANQKYTTDAVSGAMFKLLCERAKVPYQVFTNRSDMLGGSTLGNISNCQVAVNTVDIGLPQLAMHSAYETAGVKDTGYLVKVAELFFASGVKQGLPGCYELK